MEDTLPDRVRLGLYVLDLRAGELCAGGQTIILREQPLQVLRMLVERDGALLTREEIQKKLWPNDTVVEFDHSINSAIRNLRRALGDSADNPKYIETLARRGYRLMVPVEWLDTADLSDKVSAQVGGAAVRLQPEPGLTGKKVSHYRVLDIIGGGGMGVVYRAEDLKLGRQVALKFLPEELAWDPLTRRRFEREARAASLLDHPNICTIYEVEEHEEQPFLVMQLLDGETLRDRLAAESESRGTLPVEELLHIAVGVSQGLQAAHDKGIIHRDIKPANIFLTTGGQVKILDFGIAKLIGSTKDYGSDELRLTTDAAILPATSCSPDTPITRLGATLGTAGYMSPEQVRGEKLDARSDLFSFGLVLYEMATGHRAFSGDTQTALKQAILNDTPVPARDLKSTLPPQLEPIIAKALEKSRRRRYQSAAELRADLTNIWRDMSAGDVVPTQVAKQIGEAEKKSSQPAVQLAKRENPPRRRGQWIAAMLVVATCIAAGSWYALTRLHPALRQGDTLVFASFENLTGDSVFDNSLNNALRIAISQSPYFNTLPSDKVRRTLKLMNQPRDTRLTAPVAREVCQRTNSKAFLTASIADAGNHYRLNLQAVNCRTGKTLASSTQDAGSRDVIVRDLGIAAADIRKQLGEPAASLERFNSPLEQALTPSLEALQSLYNSGKQKVERGDVADMFSGLHRAVELDPKLAQAYLMLGIGYLNKQESDLSFQNLTRAYELRDRVTARTRFAIETFYYINVTGEAEKSLQTLTEWEKTYPEDYTPGGDLANDLMAAAQYERAAAEAQESVRLQPSGFGYVNLMSADIRLMRLEEAKAAFDEAKAANINDGNLYVERYLIAFLQNDEASMQQLLALAGKDPGSGNPLLGAHSDTEAYRGRLASATKLSEQAAEAAKSNGSKQDALLLTLSQVLRQVEIGDASGARQHVAAVLALSKQREVKAMAALVLARAGDLNQAETLADELNRASPLDSWMQRHELPVIRAAVELGRGNAAKAIDYLIVASSYELADLGFRGFPPVYPIYLRGEAYLQAGQGQLAAGEFQKIIDHPGIVTNFITGALAHVQLARAQAMMGDKTAARKSYQDFLSLWRGADPGIPIYKQSRAEYAKLQ